MESPRTDRDLLADLGERLARERLRQNLTQEVLAREAGVSRTTVRRMEGGQSTQLTNLVRILRALRLVGNLDALVPDPVVSPLRELERHRRFRASPSHRLAREGQHADKPDVGADKKGGWRWGDEE